MEQQKPLSESGGEGCEQPTTPAASVAPERVDHPKHYNDHPSGVECIVIIEHYGFNVGNAMKYLWRAGIKTSDPLEDLKKARWYVDREIQRVSAR